VAYFASSSTINSSSNLYWDNTNNRLGIGNSSPSFTLDVSGTGRFTGIVTFGSTLSNGTYAYTLPSATGTLALTSAIPANPVGGTGTTNTIPKFTASSTIGDSAITDDGTTVTLVSRALSGTSATFSGGVTAQTGEFISGGQDGATGSVVRISTTSTNAAARNWGIVNTWDNYGDLTFRVSNAQGGNALSAGSTKMVILSSGNVGIGTSSPSALLHLNASNIPNRGQLTIQSTDYSQITFYKGATTSTDMVAQIYTESTGSYPLNINANQSTGYIVFGAGGGTERMRITSGGNVLIGTTSDDASIWKLQVATNADVGLRLKSSAAAYTSRFELAAAGGGASVINAQGGANTLYVSANNTNGVYITSGATSWTGNSDERLKDITGNIENAIDSLMALRTVKHTWKSDESKKEHLALIAQDVEKVFPQVIDKNKLPSKADDENPDETEYLGVRYTELVPVLVKAIQEMNTKIIELEKIVATK
jgi:hypothetical protein